MDTQQPKNNIETLFETAKSYVDTRVEIATLKATKKSAEAVSSMASKLIIGGIVLLFLMVLNIALGFWLGELLGKYYYGFFVVAFIYLLLGIVVYVSRDTWIKTPAANAIVKLLNK